MKARSLLTLLACTALSAEVLANENFKKFSDLSEVLKSKYSVAHQAQFKFKAGGGSRCTGTFISNEGHGLTAAHCVERCMPFPGARGLKHWGVDVLVDGKKSKRKLTATTWSYPTLCEAEIDGTPTQIEILAGPKGRHFDTLPLDMVFRFKQDYWITDQEADAIKTHWMNSFHNGWGMGADFAIFKVVSSNSLKTSCLKLSDAEEFKGEHYTLSYPGRTSIGSKEVNEELYLSVGQVFQGNYYNSEVLPILDQNFRYLNSDLWASPGSSGASLVDEFYHTVAGVLSAAVGHEGITKDELPTARFVSTKVIREQAGSVLSQISCDSSK